MDGQPVNAELPRDEDGYLDLDRFPAEELDLSVAGWAPTPQLPDEAWEVVVTSAVHVPPEELGVDVEQLLGGLPDPDGHPEDSELAVDQPSDWDEVRWGEDSGFDDGGDHSPDLHITGDDGPEGDDFGDW